MLLKKGNTLTFDKKLLTLLRKKKNDKVQRIFDEYRPNEASLTISRLKDSFQETLLHYAAKFGNEEIVKYLVSSGSEIDALDYLGKTPLVLAVERNHIKVIKVLLKAKADFKATKQGKSALQMILGCKSIPPRTLRILFEEMSLQQIIEINLAKNLRDADLPLSQIAAIGNVELVKLLLDEGFYAVDDKNPADFRTALHTAVEMHYEEMVKLLVEYGANIDVLDSCDATPLWYLYSDENDAESNEGLEILKILLTRTTLLTTCCSYGGMQIRSVMINGCKVAVKQVLQRIDNLYVCDDSGHTVMHYLVDNGNADVIETLRDRDFDVDARTELGLTALHQASEKHLSHAVKFLLEKGADVHALDDYCEETPLSKVFGLLFMGLLNPDETKKCIQLLLDCGADADDGHNFSLVSRFHDDLLLLSRGSNTCRSILPLMQPILAHLAVKKTRGIQISEDTLSEIQQQTLWVEYFDMCERQLEQMKETAIYGDVKLFDFFQDSERKILAYVRNEELVSKLEKLIDGFKEDSPYSDLLRNRLVKAIQMAELKKNATAAICRIVGSKHNAHYFPAEYIVDYLSNEDMKNLLCAWG